MNHHKTPMKSLTSNGFQQPLQLVGKSDSTQESTWKTYNETLTTARTEEIFLKAGDVTMEADDGRSFGCFCTMIFSRNGGFNAKIIYNRWIFKQTMFDCRRVVWFTVEDWVLDHAKTKSIQLMFMFTLTWFMVSPRQNYAGSLGSNHLRFQTALVPVERLRNKFRRLRWAHWSVSSAIWVPLSPGASGGSMLPEIEQIWSGAPTFWPNLGLKPRLETRGISQQ